MIEGQLIGIHAWFDLDCALIRLNLTLVWPCCNLGLVWIELWLSLDSVSIALKLNLIWAWIKKPGEPAQDSPESAFIHPSRSAIALKRECNIIAQDQSSKPKRKTAGQRFQPWASYPSRSTASQPCSFLLPPWATTAPKCHFGSWQWLGHFARG